MACADGESINVACPDSQKCLLFRDGKAGNKELLNGESTCHRQKIFAVFASSFFPRALGLLIFRVRFVGGNLIALKQFEKMIQNRDSKHLITV